MKEEYSFFQFHGCENVNFFSPSATTRNIALITLKAASSRVHC